MGQFIAFFLAFLLKITFLIYLIFSKVNGEPDISIKHNFTTMFVWTAIICLWAGLPFTYALVQNYSSFKLSMQQNANGS